MKLDNYVYKEVAERILKEHRSLREFMLKNNIGVFFLKFLKKGMVSDSEFKNYKKVLKYFKIKYPNNLEYQLFENHIEAYGSLNDLEKFKMEFNIPNNIIFEKYKEKWHLAFHGFLCEYIKLKEKNRVE